jgi:hypothetical protein
MRYLFVFCEGDDDERFFARVCAPRLTMYDTIQYVQYAQSPAKKVRAFVRSIYGMRESGIDAEYVFLRDFDRAPSKASRLEQVARRYQGLVEPKRTFLVVQMIESWYAAGLPNQHAIAALGDIPPTTNDFTKDDFANALDNAANRINVLQEVLKQFSVRRARIKNRSFDYFCRNVFD